MAMIRCDLHKKLICPKYSFIDFFPLLFFLREEVGRMKKKASKILNNLSFGSSLNSLRPSQSVEFFTKRAKFSELSS